MEDKVEPLHQWILDQVRLPGVLAASLVLPTKTVKVFFCSGIEESAFQHASLILADACDVAVLHQIQPNRFTWKFRNARFSGSLRPDGVILILMIQNESTSASNLQIEQLLNNFRSFDQNK